MFAVMDTLIFENTDSMNIMCQCGCLFSRSDQATKTQVRLQNPFFRLAGRVNSEIVDSMRNTEWIIRELFAIFTVQLHTQSLNTF